MGTRAVPTIPPTLPSSSSSSDVPTTAANLSGVPRLLEDMSRLLEDKDSADLVFLVGREESPIYAHRIILQARCKNFGGFSKRAASPVRMPHAHPDTFRQFLGYVYTGKIVLQDSTKSRTQIFELLALAQEMGLEELWRSCEEHASLTLSPDNACALLSAALEAAQDKNTLSFIDKCFAYIGENAAEIVKTNASLCSLPQEAVIKLISSDYLSLEEEDVWRAVLSWAKYQAGVSKPTQHWSEEERARVCQHLAGVINHVRLLLIDSQVFAEEVEPTGAVPIELSLERYRYAALPNKHVEGVCSDKRLQPRVGSYLFSGSQILSKEKMKYQRLLNQWYIGSNNNHHTKQSWRLIYRASSHGYAASDFHLYCDGLAPTYVVVLGSRGEICGGFSDVPWGKPSAKGHHYTPSDKAFLFSLVNPNQETVKPMRFDIVKKPFAICYHPDIGPIFGAGADLLISSNCNANVDSYSNLPHSYDGENASNSVLMGDYYFTVVDYEVFTLNTKPPTSNSHKPH